MAAIFRKAALDRLASPEQLDQLLYITRPRYWLLLVSIGTLLAGSVYWGFQGTVTTKVPGQGVIVRTGGVVSIAAPGAGQLLNLDVKIGQEIHVNDVLGKIAQPNLIEQIRLAREAMEEARGEHDRVVKLAKSTSGLQVQAIDEQIANHEREIREIEAQAVLAREDIPVEDQLFAKGLVTKQQTLNARQKVIALESQQSTLKAANQGLASQRFIAQGQPEQSEAAALARVADLRRRLQGLENQLVGLTNIISPYAGEVIEIKVNAGAEVNAGEALLSIQPAVDQLEVIAYISSSLVKQVTGGMEIRVEPSTVKKQEYGTATGTVTFVADYPSTKAALMRNFSNESLVGSLTSSGPVTEIHARLVTDANGGFIWSSSRIPPFALSGGTLCTVQVIAREQRPIDLVIPAMAQPPAARAAAKATDGR